MDGMLAQSLVGCFLAVVGMLLALGLARLAANIVIFGIGVCTCALVVYQIVNNVWIGWPNICVYSLMSGGIGALLTLPVFPFSSFGKRK